ncbi:MAG: hypothetical protein ACI8T1_001436 [Verrucomicrobiales bacterium]|jgi:hypothetical protein
MEALPSTEAFEKTGSPSDWLGLNQRIPKKSGSVKVLFVTDDQWVMGSDSAQHLSENHRPDLHQS